MLQQSNTALAIENAKRELLKENADLLKKEQEYKKFPIEKRELELSLKKKEEEIRQKELEIKTLKNETTQIRNKIHETTRLEMNTERELQTLRRNHEATNKKLQDMQREFQNAFKK